MRKKQPWGLKQYVVAVVLIAFVFGGVGLYAFSVAQHREAVAQLKAVEKQYAEYRARQEKLLKYRAEFATRQRHTSTARP